MKHLSKIFIFLLLMYSWLTQAQEVIGLETSNAGLYYVITDSEELVQAHFGEKLISPDDLLLVSEDPRGKAKMAFDAYPSLGAGSVNEMALTVTHSDGQLSTDLKYVSHDITSSEVVDELSLKLKDTYYDFYVVLNIKAYKNEDVFSMSAEIHNQEKKSVVLHDYASGYLRLHAPSYWLSHFYGSWGYEANLVEEKLEVGAKIIDSKRGIRTTQGENSAFIISLGQKASEKNGEVIVGALAWSGNYKMIFQVDNVKNLHLLAGINDFASDYTLGKGQKFQTPEFVLTYSANGKGDASRNLHSWTRKYNLRDGDSPREVILNSWEGAYFDFDEERIHQMMDDAKSLGVETFVLDDGWFGEKYPRNNDHAGLGDWKVNLKKLPSGISGLTEYASGLGINFGIWLEPEMVNPKSELAEKHPDWIVQREHREPILMRNQLLLDLTNPKVQDYVFSVVDKILNDNPNVAYVKWDANRHVQNIGSTYLPADQQSHFWVDYINGLYKVYDKLVKEHSDVVIQVCSSGGGRVDYGSLKYHHEFWTSDNTDALSRVYMQWNINHIFPAMATAAHVSMVPSHQTDRITPLKFRFDVAMSGRLGLELLPSKLTENEIDYAVKAVDQYKGIRDIVQLGDLYRLASPYEGSFASSMYVTEDQSQAVMFLYVTEYTMREDVLHVTLDGLDTNKKYRVTEQHVDFEGENDPQIYIGNEYKFSKDPVTYSGDFLMKHGLSFTMHRTYDSVVLLLDEVD